MNQFSYKKFYRRNLPHIQPEGATLFITFRLANSLPKEVVERLLAEKEQAEENINRITDKVKREEQLQMEHRRFFGKWDDALDSLACGENYLSNPQVADLIAESLFYRDDKVYSLEAFCIMPNHGHLVCIPLEDADGKYYSLSKIMHSLKRYTARESNLILGRTGAFWQHENYDHFVRDPAELERIIKYVLNNPVKAGLVDDWTKWKWSYCKYDM
ncbi:MAG: transposase [Anaerolineales bacterium]|nr:transposase [Anaerolineales bacterium]